MRILLVLVLLMALAGGASAYLTDYPNGYVLNVTANPAASPLTNYPVLITLSNASGTSGSGTVYTNGETRADWGNINITALDDSPLTFWLQFNESTSTSIKALVNVTSIGTTGTDAFIVYYGGTNITTNAQNPTPTVYQFHGAASTSFNDTLSVNPVNTSYEVTGRTTTAGADNGVYGMSAYAFTAPSTYNSHQIIPKSATPNYLVNNAGVISRWYIPAISANTYYRWRINRTPTYANFSRSGNSTETSITSNLPTTNLGLAFEKGTAFSQNWSYVRQWVETEPAITGTVSLRNFTEQDMIMSAQYTQQFHVTSASTSAPIVNVVVATSTYAPGLTDINGNANITTPYGLYIVTFSADGYTTRQISYVFDSDETHYVTLTPYTPVIPNQNTIWTPHQVVFQFLDANNNPLNSKYSSAQAIESSMPGGLSGALEYFKSAYGVSDEVAQTMLSTLTVMNSTTDSYGSTVFSMVATVKYSINITDSNGAVYATEIFPIDNYYQIKTLNATFQSQADLEISDQNIYNGESVFNTTFTEPNSSWATVGVYIYDGTGNTDGADVYLYNVDNDTFVRWSNQSNPGGYGPLIINWTIPHVPYQQWRVGAITW